MKAILVLGAAVWETGPSPTMQRRCAHALKVWRADDTSVLVACGGLGQFPPSEAAAMGEIFLSAGVPSANIILEGESTTTFENIRNAQAILREARNITKIVIVTDSYHCPRAWMVGRFFGLHPKMSAPSLKGTHVPTQIKQHLRELGAIPLYAMKLASLALRGSGRSDRQD